jgi:predicted nucleotidyltransferase
MALAPKLLDALSRLAATPSAGSLTLIGASAITLRMPDHYWHATADLDVVFAGTEPDAARLLAAQTSGRVDPMFEHRMYTPEGVKVDVLPVVARGAAGRRWKWPVSGLEMNFAGLQHALPHSDLLEVAPGLVFRVARLQVIALLKIIAYMDDHVRRRRDLDDIAHLLEYYAFDDYDRRFADDLIEAQENAEDAGAYALGRDVGALVESDERETVDAFLTLAGLENAPFSPLGPMAESKGGPWWRFDEVDDARERARARLAAFERGFRSATAETL